MSTVPKETIHYWGWTPDGQGRRCGATEGRCGAAQQTTCPACLKLLNEQFSKAVHKP